MWIGNFEIWCTLTLWEFGVFVDQLLSTFWLIRCRLETVNFGARFGAGRLLVGLLIFEVDLLWILVVWIRHQFSLTKQFSQLPLIFFGTVWPNFLVEQGDINWDPLGRGIRFGRSLKQWDLICNFGTICGSAYADSLDNSGAEWYDLTDVSDVTFGTTSGSRYTWLTSEICLM